MRKKLTFEEELNNALALWQTEKTIGSFLISLPSWGEVLLSEEVLKNTDFLECLYETDKNKFQYAINARNEFGYNPLLLACWLNFSESVIFLLKKGADAASQITIPAASSYNESINALEGNTIIHYYIGEEDSVELLKQIYEIAPASFLIALKIENNQGYTPLSLLASMTGNNDTVNFFTSIEQTIVGIEDYGALSEPAEALGEGFDIKDYCIIS